MFCTFVLITYNEEQYVFDALESIRYQVEQYGEDRTYQLVIADDCSVDRTRDFIEFWLTLHGHLFAEITRVYQQKNVGTCINVSDALKAVKGEYLYSVAGDDYLSDIDVMSVINDNSRTDIVATFAVLLKDKNLQKDIKQYWNILIQAYYKEKYVAKTVGLGSPIQAGAAWSKRIDADEVLTYMRQFGLLDDRTRYYAAYKNVQEISYKFIPVPIFIHRIYGESVTAKRGGHTSKLNSDLEHFYKDVMNDDNSLFCRISARMQAFGAKFRGKGMLEFVRYLAPYYWEEILLRILHIRGMRKLFNNIMDTYTVRLQEHIKYITSCGDALMREYEDQTL